MAIKSLEEEAECISNRFGVRYSRIYDLLIYTRTKQAKRNPLSYVINKEEVDKHAYDIVFRFIRFETYMKMGRD